MELGRRGRVEKEILDDAPLNIEAVPRLRFDVSALSILMKAEIPQARLIRGNKIAIAIYGLGDASGEGFRSTRGLQWNGEIKKINYRFGVWGEDNNGRSSNYR